MERKEYNGWTNYETWLVNLWMTNDRGSCEYWNECAKAAYDQAKADSSFTRAERATLDLSHILKNEHEEAVPEVAGLFADLINAALSEVDWREIATHLMDDVEKETEEV